MKQDNEKSEYEIDWYNEKYERIESDEDENLESYIARGTDDDGKEYTGVAVFSHGELEFIEEIKAV